MKWLPIKKVTDCPQNYIDDFFIRYNQGRDKETGDAFKIKELFENGWSDLEYLDESTPSKEGEEEAVEFAEWLGEQVLEYDKGDWFTPNMEKSSINNSYRVTYENPVTTKQLYSLFKQLKEKE